MIRRTKRKFFMGIICLSLLLPLFSFGYSPKVEAASKEAVVKSKVIHYFAVTDIYMGTDTFWRSIWCTQYCYLQTLILQLRQHGMDHTQKQKTLFTPIDN